MPLVIDPVLAYSTYLGGSSSDQANGVAVDSNGNAYISGTTDSTDFPTVGTSISGAPAAGTFDAFISKLNSAGTALVYSTYLGGTQVSLPGIVKTEGFQVAVDSSGSAYLTGGTDTIDFPITSNAYQTSLGCGALTGFAIANAILTKLSADGQSLLYSTYLGCFETVAASLAVDANQNAYISGATMDPAFDPFPTTSNAVQSTLNSSFGNAFLSRIDTIQSGASSLVYSTYLGGSTSAYSQPDIAFGVAIDANQNAYMTGWACTQGFPVTASAYQPFGSPTYCSAFLSEINTAPSGGSLVYSTLFGGTLSGDFDDGWGVTLDSAGKVYISGSASSPDFPITTGTPPNANGNAFVAEFDTSQSGLSSLLLSTVFGGSSGDSAGGGIRVDQSGNIYAAGWTFSSDFPVTSDALQSSVSLSGGTSVSFFTILGPGVSNLLYSTYLGGNPAAGYNDGVFAMTLDHNGNAYLVGQTTATNFETTVGSFQTSLLGVSNAYVVELTGLQSNLAPTITSTSSAIYTLGVPGAFTVMASGSPAPSLSESGTLPPGVSFDSTTGILSGTPLASGSYPIVFTASNGVGSNATQNFTLAVDESPTLTSANNAIFIIGTLHSFSVTATGFPTPALSESGTLPSGVTFDSGTGVLGGMPTAAGTYPITFTAANGVGSNATQSFTLTVSSSGAPTIQISSPASGTIVNPGQNVQVIVISPSDVTFTQVAVIAEDPIGFSIVQASVPVQFSFTIPANISCGSYSLTASGITTSGQSVSSDLILIDVERPDMPLSISTPTPVVTISTPGEESPISVVATFAGGSILDVTNSSNLTYSSSQTSIATVDANGIVTAVAPGQTSVLATYTQGNQSTQAGVGIIVSTPSLTPSAYSVSFGNQNVGTSSGTQQLTLTNTANGPLQIISLSATGDFSETDNCTSSSPLSPGGTCTVNIAFTPTVMGPRTGAIKIANTSSIIPVSILMTGMGN
jgi:hypothetical protein